VVPRVLLTVSVFDDDCYDLCDEKLNVPCIQSKCQSIQNIGPNSGIFIKGIVSSTSYLNFSHSISTWFFIQEKKSKGSTTPKVFVGNKKKISN
jgi:hypothetical protein